MCNSSLPLKRTLSPTLNSNSERDMKRQNIKKEQQCEGTFPSEYFQLTAAANIAEETQNYFNKLSNEITTEICSYMDNTTLLHFMATEKKSYEIGMNILSNRKKIQICYGILHYLEVVNKFRIAISLPPIEIKITKTHENSENDLFSKHYKEFKAKHISCSEEDLNLFYLKFMNNDLWKETLVSLFHENFDLYIFSLLFDYDYNLREISFYKRDVFHKYTQRENPITHPNNSGLYTNRKFSWEDKYRHESSFMERMSSALKCPFRISPIVKITQYIDLFLQTGGNFNQLKYNETLLYQSLYFKKNHIFLYLANKIDIKLSINQKNSEGLTLFQLFFHTKRKLDEDDSIRMKLFISFGAHIDAPNNKENLSLFYYACCDRFAPNFLEFLLKEAKVKIDYNRGAKGRTGFHTVCSSKNRSHTEKLTLLIDHGVDINIQDKAGNTGLHHLCRVGNVAGAELLIQKGAKLDIKNNNGETARDYAEANKRLKYWYQFRKLFRTVDNN